VAGILAGLTAGAAAGAAGTTALNAVTYLDMAVRGRPSSSTPEQTVEKAAEKAGVPIPGEGEERENRIAGLGPLQGILAGVGVGAAVGAARALGVRLSFPLSALLAGGAAMVASNGAMVALGVTDPRTWPASSWVADVVPHAAYGALTAAVARGLLR
jgi:hypothetical protein